MAVVALIVVAVVVLIAAWLLVGRRRSADGVDSFRRQIDALSAEARRSTVDQVRQQSGRRTSEALGDHPDEHLGDDADEAQNGCEGSPDGVEQDRDDPASGGTNASEQGD